MQFHTHHIIPKYKGGTDDPSNLIEVTIEEHADLHLQLWEEYGDHRDLLACHGLMGLVDKDQIMSHIFKENGKKVGVSNKGRTPWNKGKQGIYSETTLDKMRRPKTEEHKQKLRISKDSTNMKYAKSETHKNNLSKSMTGKKVFYNIHTGQRKLFYPYDIPDDSWQYHKRKYTK